VHSSVISRVIGLMVQRHELVCQGERDVTETWRQRQASAGACQHKAVVSDNNADRFRLLLYWGSSICKHDHHQTIDSFNTVDLSN
jgi:hypothetical protein